MALGAREHSAKIATLIIVRPNMLELRYQAGIVFDAVAVVGVQVKRRALMCDRNTQRQ